MSGRELLTAMAIGCDLTCRLSLAVGPRLRERRWYPPSLLAGFGAAAAAARLLGLDARGVLDAWSLALGQLGNHGELIHSPDSVMRSIRDAFPAQAALLSGLLACRGVRGYDRPFEGDAGFFAAYAGQRPDSERLLDGLGVRYAGADISFKPWPSCRATHAFIEAALDVLNRHDLSGEEIDVVRLTGSPVVGAIVAEPRERKLRPGTAIDAKFSVYFTTALALTDGQVQLSSFTPGRLHDPALARLAERVVFAPNARLDVSAGAISITTSDGRELTGEVAATYGNPVHPIADVDLRTKYAACVDHAADAIQARRWGMAADRILTLERVDDVAACLAGGE